MIPGYNLLVNVVRMNAQTDDEVGGAIFSGTTVITNQPAAIGATRPTQQSLEQGLEVEAIYNLSIQQCGVTLIERDLVEVTCPSDSPLFGLQFRVMGVQPSRLGKHQSATLSRIRRSRREQ